MGEIGTKQPLGGTAVALDDQLRRPRQLRHPGEVPDPFQLGFGRLAVAAEASEGVGLGSKCVGMCRIPIDDGLGLSERVFGGGEVLGHSLDRRRSMAA
jgi:hypothetical protein